MTRTILAALLLASLPAGHALAGSVDAFDRAALGGWQGAWQARNADGIAAYVGDRWSPITIQLDSTLVGGTQPMGLAGPRRVASGSALYNWTLAHSAAGNGTAASLSAYAWDRRHRVPVFDDDGEDYGVPDWHGHGHGYGHGHGGGSDDGGGVSAVPLPAGLPLLLSALALLGLALRGGTRD